MEPIPPHYSILVSQNHVARASTTFSVTGSQMSELDFFSQINSETVLTLRIADRSRMATS